MAAHYDLSVIAIVGIILLIGIVKKNEIMLVDFAQFVEHPLHGARCPHLSRSDAELAVRRTRQVGAGRVDPAPADER